MQAVSLIMFVKSVLALNKNENAGKNPLCVYEDKHKQN